MTRKFRIFMSVFLSLSLLGLSSGRAGAQEETPRAVEEVPAAVTPVSQQAVTIQAAGAAAYVQLVQEYMDALAYQQAIQKQHQKTKTIKNPKHSSGAPASGGSGSCANPVVSSAIAQRESGCNWNAYNASGCGGRGCIGFYQEDAGHYYAHSPWNPSQPGACYGLDSSTQAGQTECASRLGPHAWG